MSAADIGLEALEEYRREMDGNARLARESVQVSEGRGSYALVAGMAARTGREAGRILSGHLAAEATSGALGYEEALTIITPVLRENYKRVAGWSRSVQEALNQSAGIGMRAVAAPEPGSRIANLAKFIAGSGERALETLEDYTQGFAEASAEQMRRVEHVPEYAENMSMATVDDTVRANAELQSRAGLAPRIVRSQTGNCCAWCAALVGEYDYAAVKGGDKDVFRRHTNCRCTVSYEPGDGTRTNVFEAVQAREAAERAERQEELEPLSMNSVDRMGMPSYEQINTFDGTIKIKAYKLAEYDNIWSQTYSTDAQKTCKIVNQEVNSGQYGTVNRIVVVKNATLHGISAYDHETKTLYISEELSNVGSFSKIVDNSMHVARDINEVIIHELGGHKAHWDAVMDEYNSGKYRTVDEAKQAIEAGLRKHVATQTVFRRNYVLDVVSENAYNNARSRSSMNELIADSVVRIRRGDLMDEELERLVKEVIGR